MSWYPDLVTHMARADQSCSGSIEQTARECPAMRAEQVETAGPAAVSGRKQDERTRVLVVATVGFTVFFAVWVMFAIVGVPLREELGLSEGQFALLVAIPILTGSILRVPIGILTDRVGGRLVFTGLLVVTAIPTYFVSRASGYTELVVLAFFVGLAGTSFAVGIAWVSAWYPAERQGFALGVLGTK